MDAPSRVHHVPAGSGPCVTYPNNVINLKLSALESAGEMTVLEDVIPPQVGPPLHIHSRENEAYYVLEGEFEFTCGRDTVRGGPGTFVHSPRGIPHRYQNVGDVPGRLLISFTPAGIEAFFRELGDEKALNPQRMAEIMGKHGISLATPDS